MTGVRSETDMECLMHIQSLSVCYYKWHSCFNFNSMFVEVIGCKSLSLCLINDIWRTIFFLNSFHFKIRFIISLKFVVSHVSVLTWPVEADAAQSPGDVWMWDWDGVFNYIPTLSPQLARSQANFYSVESTQTEGSSSRIKRVECDPCVNVWSSEQLWSLPTQHQSGPKLISGL